MLDAGCGTGRLLLPFLREGIDVDGSDASADMLRCCGEQAAWEGLSVELYPQTMHRLQLPRTYQTVVICGAFGLGGSREQDLEGLRRIHRALAPGGRLVMDHYLPNLEDPKGWAAWAERPDLPRKWPAQGDRRTLADGAEIELRIRQLGFDPLQQQTTLEMRVILFENDAEVTSETHRIDINLYFLKEIELMLTVAGFRQVEVRAFGEARAPEPWRDGRILLLAEA